MEKQKIRVLLAEDDRNLGNILKSYLDAKGYTTSLCVNGQEAYDQFQRDKFDFCVVDVMMPLKDGFTLAKEIRQHDKNIPILFLTAKSLEEDKLKGFQAGADDYLTKPFSMEELLMRMEAIMRRSGVGQTGNKILKVGKFEFDHNLQILKLDGNEHRLTSKESELLRLLAENMNETVDRSIALNKIWQDDSYFNARSMDVYIAKLRKYLKDDPGIELINVHGIGFRLVVKS